MAEKATTVSLKYIGDITNLEEQLGRIDGITAKEAKKMVATLDANAKKALAIEKARLKATENETSKSFGRMTQLGKEFSKNLGPGISGIVDGLEGISSKAGALGPVAMGVTAVGSAFALAGIGAVALAKGAVTLANAAVDAEKRLTDLGLASFIDPAAKQSLDEYSSSTKQLQIAVDLLTTSMGAQLAPELTKIVNGATALTTTLNENVESMDVVIAAIGSVVTATSLWFPPLAAIIQGYKLLNIVLDANADKIAATNADAATRMATAKAVGENNKKVEQEHLDLYNSINDQINARVETDKTKRIQAAKDLESERIAAQKAAAAQANALNDKMNSEYHAAIAKKKQADKEMLAIEESARKERAAADKQEAEDKLALIEQIREASLQAGITLASSVGEAIAFVAQNAQEKVADSQSTLEGFLVTRSELSEDLKNAESKAEQERIKNEIAANESKIRSAQKSFDEHSKLATKLFIAEKAAAIAQSLISTALAVQQAMANLPPPVSYIAAAAAGVAGGIQTAIIAAQKPPTYGHTGLGPDEINVIARQGESLLSQRATNRLGAQAIRDLNNGQETTTFLPVSINLDGKQIAKFTHKLQRKKGIGMSTRQ